MSIDLQKIFTKRFSSGGNIQHFKLLAIQDENNSKYLIFNWYFGIEAYEPSILNNFILVIIYKEKEFLKLELIEGDWLDELELVNTVPHLINSKIKKGKFVEIPMNNFKNFPRWQNNFDSILPLDSYMNLDMNEFDFELCYYMLEKTPLLPMRGDEIIAYY